MNDCRDALIGGRRDNQLLLAIVRADTNILPLSAIPNVHVVRNSARRRVPGHMQQGMAFDRGLYSLDYEL